MNTILARLHKHCSLLCRNIILILLTTALHRQRDTGAPDYQLFLAAGQIDEKVGRKALNEIAPKWKNSYTSMLIDIARLMAPAPPLALDGRLRSNSVSTNSQNAEIEGPSQEVDPTSQVRQRLVSFLEKQTGQHFGNDLDRWRKWMWKLPYEPHPDYIAFKAQLYSAIDPRMLEFFRPGTKSLIRLDEIDWGGVKVNGIPPLGYPKFISAGEAGYLKDNNIVFGISVNGESRAYPKRILAWHELARDRVGGAELTIVYCTLCGTVLPYESEAGGKLWVLGTSGLLYRSNKLMFDGETKSLWSTLDGRPVVGPLAGSDIQLKVHPSVTTTWREWREAHPDTRVLSLDTGFTRDYSEGAAYRNYFSTDALMFQVSQQDQRLKNKAEVLVMQLEVSGKMQPIAIATEFLKRNPLYSYSLDGGSIVILTTPRGANRVYESADIRFTRWTANDQVADSAGNKWRVTEEALVPASNSERSLPRIPANRAFWFGWYAQFPNTLLIK